MNRAFTIETKTLLHAVQALQVTTPKARGECRKYLCGIRVEVSAAGGCVMVATDGHRMGVAWCSVGFNDAPTDCAFTIDEKSLALLMPALKVMAKSTVHRAECVFTPGSSAFESGSLRIVHPAVEHVAKTLCDDDGAFPPWRRVLPDQKHQNEPSVHSYNAAYIADAGKACALIMNGNAFASVRQEAGNNLQVFRCENGDLKYAHVVMAMRD